MSRVSSSPTSKPGGTAATQPMTPPPMTAQPMMPDGLMVPHEKIAMRAYELWCQRGCPAGTDRQDWYEAEKELKAELTKGGTRKAKNSKT